MLIKNWMTTCVRSCDMNLMRHVDKSMKRTSLDMCIYKVETRHRRRWFFISPCITARKIAGIYRVIFSCFSSISSPILFISLLSLSNWDYEAVSPNRTSSLLLFRPKTIINTRYRYWERRATTPKSSMIRGR